MRIRVFRAKGAGHHGILDGTFERYKKCFDIVKKILEEDIFGRFT